MPARFYLIRPKSKKPTGIKMRFAIGKSKHFECAINQSVLPKNWNSKKQRVKEQWDIIGGSELNEHLKFLSDQCDEVLIRLKRSGNYTENDFKREFLKAINKEKSDQITSVSEMFEAIQKKATESLKGQFKSVGKFFGEFEDAQIEKKKIFSPYRFEDLSLEVYYDLIEFYQEVMEYSPNTIGKHIRRLKEVMQEGVDQGLHSNLIHTHKKFKAPTMQTDEIYLTEDEVIAFYEVECKSKVMEISRDLFVVTCMTCLRYSDIEILEGQLLKRNVNGREVTFVSKKTEKTKEPVMVPAKKEVLDIIEKYEGKLPKPPSNNAMNLHVKEIGGLADIDQPTTLMRYNKKSRKMRPVTKPKHEWIKTHTARRSAATNMYKSGVPMKLIRDLGGWSSYDMLMRYLKIKAEEAAMIAADHPFFN